MKTELIDYQDDDVLLEAYCAYKEDDIAKKPVVLIAHDWSGRNNFACKKADLLAELGYIGFAIDMYGKGKIGQSKEEKLALMNPLMNDRAKLQKRMIAGFKKAQSLKNAIAHQIAAIGFCFGGLCALDLARCNQELVGTMSLHGLLGKPGNPTNQEITAKVVALHGYDDPMVTPTDVLQFCDEMTTAKADWQVHLFGHTMHAFTNPEANDPGFGTVYNQEADARSLRLMQDFLKEVFG
jgi:dienelactone hydrolase